MQANLSPTFIYIRALPYNAYAEESQIISYEEYSSALIEKFAEYGRTLVVEPMDGEFLYTKELLEQELRNAEEYLAKPITIDVIDSDITVSEEEKDGIRPASMIGTERLSKETSVLFTETVVPKAYCKVKTTATITSDYQRDYVMSGATPTLELTTGIAMDDYVVLNSYKTEIDNTSSTVAKRCIAYEINAKFKLDYSAIGVTAWEKVDKTFGVVFYPFA